LTASGPVSIGLDLGGTKILGLAVDEAGEPQAEVRVPTPRGGDAIVDALLQAAEALRADVPGVTEVGVGAPGLVDASGILRFAPNLPGVVDLDLPGLLEARLPGTTVQLENDASCAGIGEWTFGAAQGATHALLVTLGTGIGGGIITPEGLYRGAHGFAGEIGHMVVEASGPRCVCGQRGCWERYASGSGLARLAREAALAGRAVRTVELAGGDPEAVRGEHVTAAAREGDAEALEVMGQFAWWLALGLSNLANLLDVEMFVIGGGLVEAGDLILAPARRAFADMVEGGSHRPTPAIAAATLGERAGAIGAAVVARRS
jgi:glucokinase